jgi:hypothetical protein
MLDMPIVSGKVDDYFKEDDYCGDCGKSLNPLKEPTPSQPPPVDYSACISKADAFIMVAPFPLNWVILKMHKAALKRA